MTEYSNEPEKFQRIKLSRWGISSAALIVIAIFACFFLSESCVFYRTIKSLLLLMLSISATIFAVIMTKRSKGKMLGRGLGILMIIFSVCFGLCTFMVPNISVFRDPKVKVCGYINMRNLGNALLMYAHDNNDMLPSADKWCDLLIAHTKVTQRDFICPASYMPVYSYGFNKNLSNKLINQIHGNIVLLFETDGGKNVSGGPEQLMKSGRHHQGASNVLFSDFHVECIQRNKLVDLKWDFNDQMNINEGSNLAK